MTVRAASALHPSSGISVHPSYLRMVPAVGRFTGGEGVDLLFASRTADQGPWTDWRAGNAMLSVLPSPTVGSGPPTTWLDMGTGFSFSNMLWLFRIPKL